MPVEIKEPQNSDQLLGAVEEQLRRHDLRLRPNQTLDALVNDLKTAGLNLAVEHNTLTGKVGDLVANVPAALENFATKNADRFYPRDVSTGVTAKDQMDRKAKSDYIAKHGLAMYERLPLRSPAAQPVELSSRTMTRQQWFSLPRTQRAELAGSWGADAVARIMARSK